MSLADIREALAETIERAIPDVHAYPRRPGVPELPAAIVNRKGGPVPDSNSGTSSCTLVVTVLTALGDESSGQEALDALVDSEGDSSIRSAIDADETLGAAVAWAEVESIGEDQIIEYGGVSYLGAEIIIAVGI